MGVAETSILSFTVGQIKGVMPSNIQGTENTNFKTERTQMEIRP